MCSAATVEKIGSESEKRTSAGRSQRVKRRPHLDHLRRRRMVGLGRDELGEGEDAGLRLRRREGCVVRLDDVVARICEARDANELTRDEVGTEPPHELAEPKPLGRGRTARADAGVEDHEPRHAVGPLDCESEPDRPAPVLDDDRGIAEVDARPRSARSRRSGSRTSSPRSPSACPSGRSRSSRARPRVPSPRASGSSFGTGTPTSARRGEAARGRRCPRPRSACEARPARRSGARTSSREALRTARRVCGRSPSTDHDDHGGWRA